MSTVNCPSYQCADLEPYPEAADCATYKGGANQIVLLKCGLDTDITNGTAVQAAIDAGDAILYTNVKINYEAPSPVTSPSYVACVRDLVAAYDWSITFIDRNVTPGSVDHYNSVNSATGFTFGAALIWECAEERVSYIDSAPITLQGGRLMPDQNDDLQRFEHQLIFRSDLSSLPIMATPPAGIFN